jgi:hypothetical protein
VKIVSISPEPSADEAAAIEAALRSFLRVRPAQTRSRWAVADPVDLTAGRTWARVARREAIAP